MTVGREREPKPARDAGGLLRDREFESTSLQERVYELSVPVALNPG
jgi:PHD/YefM family antitoxin component YafN of YafNO toxin-antitoxin module